MKYFGAGLSEKHKQLQKMIRKAEELEEAKKLFLDIHATLHLASVSNTSFNEVDQLVSDLTNAQYTIMPTKADETIAWVFWHLARIEDITINVLVARQDTIFNKDWQQRLHVVVKDTGNAMSDDEIIEFSKTIQIQELLAYRNAVGKRTREVVAKLQVEDMKRKVKQADLQRIEDMGGVTSHPDSKWLLDFWGKKDVAGILLMPPLRHAMLHLNDCCHWKEQMQHCKVMYRE